MTSSLPTSSAAPRAPAAGPPTPLHRLRRPPGAGLDHPFPVPTLSRLQGPGPWKPLVPSRSAALKTNCSQPCCRFSARTSLLSTSLTGVPFIWFQRFTCGRVRLHGRAGLALTPRGSVASRAHPAPGILKGRGSPHLSLGGSGRPLHGERGREGRAGGKGPSRTRRVLLQPPHAGSQWPPASLLTPTLPQAWGYWWHPTPAQLTPLSPPPPGPEGLSLVPALLPGAPALLTLTPQLWSEGLSLTADPPP